MDLVRNQLIQGINLNCQTQTTPPPRETFNICMSCFRIVALEMYEVNFLNLTIILSYTPENVMFSTYPFARAWIWKLIYFNTSISFISPRCYLFWKRSAFLFAKLGLDVCPRVRNQPLVALNSTQPPYAGTRHHQADVHQSILERVYGDRMLFLALTSCGWGKRRWNLETSSVV